MPRYQKSDFFFYPPLDSVSLVHILSHLNYITISSFIMTAYDYLLKFRKVSTIESLEKLFDHLNYSLTDNQEIINMYRAADHRRAELVSGGKLFDLGCVPKSVWRYVM